MKNFILHGIDDIKICENDEILNESNSIIYCMGICLNSGCTYDCLYCYAKGNPTYSIEEQLKVAEYKELIEQASLIGCKTIIITGVASPSEPLLSTLLVPVIKFISSKHMTTLIYTNASILGDDELCTKIHHCSANDLCSFFFENDVSLMISCDSINGKDYNKIVQNQTFTTFQKALKNLSNNNYLGVIDSDGNVCTRVAISTVICKLNINQLYEIRDYFHQFNWQFICKFPSLIGNTKKYSEFFFKSDEVIELRKNSSDKYTDKRETLVIESESGNRYCLANQLGIAVNGKGQILSCLSGDPIFDDSTTIRNNDLLKLIIAKKRKFGLNAGECPKKKKFYKD